MGLFDSIFGGAASDPVHPFWYGGSMPYPTNSGIAVSEESAMTYSAAYAATVLLSSAGAALPLNLFRKNNGRRYIQTDHPLNDLVHNRPNEHSFSSAFRMRAIQEQVNWTPGFCAEIERNELGEIVNLWPIHPSRVTYEITRENRLVYRVSTRTQMMVEFSADEVLHVPGRFMRDEVGSIGVIAHARESIGLGLATERHGASSFRNGVRPTVAIKMNGSRLTPESRENFRRDFSEINAGSANAGRPVLLDQQMELQPFSFSNEDSQFLQTRQHNVEEVARWYNVPPHLIGHLLRSTFNNIETQSIEFVVYSLMPWLVQWEGAMNKRLLTDQQRREGYYFKFNVNGLLRGDNKSRSEFYNRMAQIGVFSINEIRELEELNPVEGGDDHFIQLNMRDVKEDREEAEDRRRSEPRENTSGREAAIIALESCLRYLTEIEATKAIEAAKDSRKFTAWLEGFYGSHLGKCREALTPAVALCVAADVPLPDQFIESRCKRHREELDAACDKTPAEFAATIRDIVCGWRDNITQEVQDATQE